MKLREVLNLPALECLMLAIETAENFPFLIRVKEAGDIINTFTSSNSIAYTKHRILISLSSHSQTINPNFTSLMTA